MKKIIHLALICITLTSCNSLYNVPSTPALLLSKADGTAINANLGTNYTTKNAAINITHPLSDNVSINASLSTKIGATKYDSIDIYKDKNQTNFAVNMGFNLNKIVKYPIQFWIGYQTGSSTASFGTYDSITPYFINHIDLTKGRYTAINYSLCNVIYSNYGNDINVRNGMRNKFDIIESFMLKPVKYTYINSDNIGVLKNTFLGYGLTIRYAINKFEFVLSDSYIIGSKMFFDELFNKGYKGEGFTQYARSNPSFGITYYISRRKNKY